MVDGTEPDILFDARNGVGRIVLNRPKVLNALNLSMCAAMREQLRKWAQDEAIRVVVVSGKGRAFCAGGDVRALSENTRAREDGLDFLRLEYWNNAAIKRFPKPYVALTDGFTMGGGVGLSVHGSHRVATENTVWAMPETLIGFFPDIGGSYFLPRLPGELGMYLGLTGASLRAADLLYSGIATHAVPASRTSEIVPRLEAGDDLDHVLADLGMDPGAAPLKEMRASIDRAFSAGSVEEIFERLGSEGAWGEETRALLAGRSPTSLKLAFRELREGRQHGFEECMRMEFRIAARIVKDHDFHEGVRAALIDKDRKPVWKPARLRDVTDASVEAHFKPMPGLELVL